MGPNANSSKNTRRSKLLDLCKKSADLWPPLRRLVLRHGQRMKDQGTRICAKTLLTSTRLDDFFPDMATKAE